MEKNKEFENAYLNLLYCFDMLNETGSVSTTIEVVDGMEKKYIIKLLDLVSEVHTAYKADLKRYKDGKF